MEVYKTGFIPEEIKQMIKRTKLPNIPDRGLIHDLSEFLKFHSDTNGDWAEAIAITVMANAMNKKVYVTSIKGSLKLNMFYLVIGPSGISNKSLPFIANMIPLYKKILDISTEQRLLPSRFTMEGMMEKLATEQSEGLIWADEFTNMFKSAQKTYMSDILEFLCEMYDGYISARYTRTTKAHSPGDIYINLLSTTTEQILTSKHIDAEFFTGGLGNRFLYILDDPSKRPFILKDPKSYLMNPTRLYNKFEQEIEEFAMRILQYNNTNLQDISYETDSANLITEFTNYCEKQSRRIYVRDKLSPESTYLNRLPVKLLKLAALHCISFNEKHIVKGTMTDILIRPQSVIWAMERIFNYYEYFRKMMTRWVDLQTQQVAVRSEEKVIQRVFNSVMELAAEKANPITMTKIRHKLRWTHAIYTERLNGALDWLVSEKRIKKTEYVSGKRKTFHYSLL